VASAATPAHANSTRPADALAATAAPLHTAGAPAAMAQPVHVETVTAPAFTPAWQDETVGKLAHVVLTRQERAELKLNPAELGPVAIRVDMQADQASVSIVAASPETRSALEQSLPQLRDLLAGQGITLAQASVHDGGGQRDAQGWTFAHAGTRDSATTDTTAPAATTLLLRRPDRLVDLFA
jgi:flagellar hook-length control protein FliK